jgi:hypothetical protein
VRPQPSPTCDGPQPSFWPSVLKVLVVLSTAAASALGSYRAARSEARGEAEASYAELRRAVEHLEQTQRMIWDVVVRSPGSASKSLDSPLPGELSRPFVGMRPLPRDLEAVIAGKQGVAK